MDVAAVLTAASALFGGVVAGVYVGFDLLVMPGLRRRPVPDAVRAMQEINRAAVRGGFMLLFFGSALLAVAALVTAVIDGGPAALTRIVGNALIASGFVSTIALNVPRNTAIDALDPATAEAPARWQRLERGWVIANRLRALTALVGTLGLLLSFLLPG